MSNSSYAKGHKSSKEQLNDENKIIETLRDGTDTKGKAKEIDPSTSVIDNVDRGPEKSEEHSTVLVVLTIGICLVAFAVSLDNTILATAIPRITAEFDTLDNAAWYRSASFVASAGLQLPLAKLYTYFDAKWTYLASLTVFELGCVICAVATNPDIFIAGRAVSGAGAAGLYPGVVNILGLAASAKLRPVLFAVVTGAVGVASLVGPPVGGIFTDSSRMTWRWCFWVNLPIGGVAGAIVLLALRPPRLNLWKKTDTGSSDGKAQLSAKQPLEQTQPLTQKLLKLDPVGTIFLSGATVSLLLALQWGGTSYYWTDKPVWGCLAAAGLLLSSFAFVQRYFRDPASASIPPGLFRCRTVLTSALLATTLSAALLAHVFLLPFYFQAVRGTTATGSGLRMLAYLGAAALGGVVFGAAVASGRVGRRYGVCAFVATGLFVVGAGLLHTLGVDTPPGTAAAYQVVAGVAVGVAWQVPFVAVQQQQRAGELGVGGHGVANALIACANSFGAALGIFVVQNIFLGTLASGLGDVAGLTTEHVDAILRAGRLPGMRDPVFMNPLLLHEVVAAFAAAVDAAFVFPVVAGVFAFLASLILLW
ncbi:hypothetical protein PgNI_06539 [Pyricularia grisea]|uniref:Major facilitator superfamily (MFS) profile domain-containing protein n=1 Tax=Pyricularia grisea TaxID=148305 RepID=A0A6P8B7Z3_PYRGI|nr:hypothetical protein PgNI_06539 [Pyricularia grisea]TLD11363.1 hypothetical protein PgNI_06539 [Pyricularia grisea]